MDSVPAARLACADSSFPGLSHEVALAVIADLGIEAVDVCVFPSAHTDPRKVEEDPSAVASALGELLAGHGLAVSDVFLILAEDSFEDLAINHPDEATRANSFRYFERALELARQLGSPGLSVLPGMPFEDPRASLELAAAELRRRAEAAAEAGVALSFEPHYESIAQTPDLALELLGHTPGVSLALDYSHFVYQGFAQADIDPLIPHARHLHLRQAAPGVMQAPAHEGAIDFPRLLERLAQARYGGYLCLEYQSEEWLECNRVDCISETASLRDLLLAAATTPAR
jgi:sugar phosphate isomerase/epimerase